MQSKMSFPLIVCIAATAAFNCLPSVLGHGSMMYAAFAFYIGLVVLLSLFDRRALVYALVLTVCCPAGGLAPLSYSLLLALVIIAKEIRQVGRVLNQLMAYRWWLLLVLAAGTALLSVPMWSHDVRGFATDAKEYLSHLGYLVVFGLAVAVTLDDAYEARRVLSLGCLFIVLSISAFYFLGEKGVPPEYAMNVAIFSSQQYQQIGLAYMAFTRTQMCILLAVTAAVSLALSISALPRVGGVMLLGITGICVYLIMQLASTGSAFAMVVGMGVSGLGYVVSRPTPLRVISSVLVVAVLGSALVYAVFQTDNLLAERIELKQRAMGIDRMELWVNSVDTAIHTPLGSGWTTEFAPRRYTHNDFLVYYISFGWLAGTLYFGGGVLLGLWFVRCVLRAESGGDVRALALAGLAGITVYGANSMLDMLSAGVGNYQAVWALILVSAVVVAVPRREPDAVAYLNAEPANYYQ